MQYLIRFTQLHESFRLAEIQALAVLAGVDLKIVYYNDEVSEGHFDYHLVTLLSCLVDLLFLVTILYH
jgi:tRNA (guanine10-N2)-methyltransferase